MSITTLFSSLLTSAQEDRQKLDDIIKLLQGVAIETNGEYMPSPTYNETTDVWTINQDTADSNGIYAGVYKFALDTACSVLTISSVTGHTTPANTAFPAARYTDCDDVVHDVASVMDLSGKAVKRFEIYSDTAFTVELTVSNEWVQDYVPRYTDKQGWVFTLGRNIANKLWSTATGLGVFECYRDVPTMRCDKITFGVSAPHVKSNNLIRFRLYHSNTIVKEISLPLVHTSAVYQYEYDVSDVNIFDKVMLYVQSGPVPDVNAYLMTVKFEGTGTNPFV